MRALCGIEKVSGHSWQSRSVLASQACPGVELVVSRMTFGRRLELMVEVRGLATRLEYFQAGREAGNEIEASLLGAEIDKLYVLWGVDEVRGLELDGATATVETMIQSGPEALFLEALEAVRKEIGLNDDERKN
jgi:hypothetical protein